MAITDHQNYNSIMTLVNSLIIKIRNAQADYFVKRNQFFQGLRMPTMDCDGILSLDINYGLRPSDQTDSWNDFDKTNWKLGVKLPFNLSIDVYESPEGWGWIMAVEFWAEGFGPDKYGHDGNHWVYKHNEGPAGAEGVFDDWYIEEDLPI